MRLSKTYELLHESIFDTSMLFLESTYYNPPAQMTLLMHFILLWIFIDYGVSVILSVCIVYLFLLFLCFVISIETYVRAQKLYHRF